MALRPEIQIGTAAVTVSLSGGPDFELRELERDLRNQFDKQKIHVGHLRGIPFRVDLTGQTVSVLTIIHKGLRRVQKSAQKRGVEVSFQYEGDALEYPLDMLMAEPTPAEDADIIRKIRKSAILTAAQWARAFELLGLAADPVKDDRKVVGFRVTFPGMAEGLYEIRYGVLSANHYGNTAETARYEEARTWLIEQACSLLGLDNPTMGVPPRARDARTNLSIRTCPCCFRDIKASEHTQGRMADHGFQIHGRDRSHHGGQRVGSCDGVGELPWEQSSAPTREKVLAPMEAKSDRTETSLARLLNGQVEELCVQEYNYRSRDFEVVTLTKLDGYKWDQALARKIDQTRRDLAALWDGRFFSIPWLRMALRTWQPHPDTEPAVGAPTGQPDPEDFAGKPDIL